MQNNEQNSQQLDKLETNTENSGNEWVHNLQEESSWENQPHPWLRFFARKFDIVWFMILFGIIFTVVSKAMGVFEQLSSFKFFDLSITIISMGVYTIFEALMLSNFSTTPGKWLLNIKVLDQNYNKISFLTALKRSTLVYTIGSAIGIPILLAIAYWFGYSTLVNDKQTKWDKDCNTIVLHKKPNLFGQIIVVVVYLIVLCLALVSIFSNLD